MDYAYHATILPPIDGVERLAAQIIKSAPPKRRDELQMDLFGLGVA